MSAFPTRRPVSACVSRVSPLGTFIFVLRAWNPNELREVDSGLIVQFQEKPTGLAQLGRALKILRSSVKFDVIFA